MNRSGDLVIGGSGDREGELTAETRSRGENQKPTTEAPRHGEESGDLLIARDRVIGKAACICHPERVGAHATASRRILTLTVPVNGASGSSHETLPNCDIFTAEPRRRGEQPTQNFTTEAPRHGEIYGNDDSSDHPINRGPRRARFWLGGVEVTCDHPITRSPSAFARIAKAACTLLAALREIFDESAYDRFLLRTHAARSVASYRAFTHERDASMQRKPRCC